MQYKWQNQRQFTKIHFGINENQIQTVILIHKSANPKLLANPLRYKKFKLQQIDFNLLK